MSQGYIPIPPPPALPMIQRPSSFSRNWKWFLPTVILGPLLLISLFIGGILAFVYGLMKSSEPYHHALAEAEGNPQVVRELGAPIEPGWFLTGSINQSNSTGDADITIPLNGKLHHGRLHVVAKKADGTWTYQTLDVMVDGDSASIPLLPDSPAQQDKD